MSPFLVGFCPFKCGVGWRLAGWKRLSRSISAVIVSWSLSSLHSSLACGLSSVGQTNCVGAGTMSLFLFLAVVRCSDNGNLWEKGFILTHVLGFQSVMIQQQQQLEAVVASHSLAMGCRGGTVVKNPGCFPGGPRFNSQHLRGISQSGNLTPSSGLV